MARKKKDVVEDPKNGQQLETMEQPDFGTTSTQQPDGTQKPEERAQVRIGEAEVQKAMSILQKYKEEKTNLEQHIINNELYWKMQHWEASGAGKDDKRIKPKSAWLFNTIINKHADMMDNYPEANILPRSKDDETVAKELSCVIPVIMEQNGYEDVYSDAAWYKIKNGTSVQGVFWNGDKNNGLGDVDVRKIDLLHLFWKGGITDIQDSPNVFHVTMADTEMLREHYPDLRIVGDSGNLLFNQSQYIKDENIDESEQTALVDWYYKKTIEWEDPQNGLPQKKTVLHYCKFCNGQVIYASENDPEYEMTGWYNHGLYPFVFDVLFPVERSICGQGYIDILKDNQLYIDKLQQAIMENAVANARPRWIVRKDGNINEEELMDTSKTAIHTEGSLGEDSFKPLTGTQFNSTYESIMLQKIQEMKDTSGNTAASQGQTSSVTSASGIASLQEAAGKLSRDANLESYRAYKQVVNLVIELIRQFYTEKRMFRITGSNGNPEYVQFSNAGLAPMAQGGDFGLDLGSREPIMDIDVKPQKKNAYSKESQNQTALNLYSAGFFAPDNADAALACMEMMDFDGIEKMKEKVAQNGTLYQQVMALQQQVMQLTAIIDAQNGTSFTQQAAGQAQQTMARNSGQSGGSVQTSKGSLSSQAANAARQSTSPR